MLMSVGANLVLDGELVDSSTCTGLVFSSELSGSILAGWWIAHSQGRL
jgi:hypothetical protein